MTNMTTMQAAAWEMIFQGGSVRLNEAIISCEAGQSMANVANPNTIFPSVRMVVFRRSTECRVTLRFQANKRNIEYWSAGDRWLLSAHVEGLRAAGQDRFVGTSSAPC
jgi:hypothetical protein